MNASRRRAFGVFSAFAAAPLAGGLAPSTASAHSNDDDGLRAGAVFTSSNDASGNEVLVHTRSAGGGLALSVRVPTNGLGSGAGLGSQGAVALSGDGRFLFVVNAGSHTVSTFAVRARELQLLSVVASGGLHPISVAESDGTVYVLNDGGAGNVAGFRNVQGELRPIAGSVRGLSVAGGAAPAQVGFSDDGEALVVTEKNTNRLTSYRVAHDGRIGVPIVTPSSGTVPFGFAFSRRNRLLVTEAGTSSLSSYRFSEADPVRPVVVSASVPDTQGAACWVAITPNGRYAYVANTAASSVSSYRIGRDGAISLLAGVAGRTGAGSAPADTAISADGRHLYVRNGGTATIGAFAIEPDGALNAAPFGTGLPAAAVGLAAN